MTGLVEQLSAELRDQFGALRWQVRHHEVGWVTRQALA